MNGTGQKGAGTGEHKSSQRARGRRARCGKKSASEPAGVKAARRGAALLAECVSGGAP